MGWPVSWHSEAARKGKTLAKRLRRLRGAVKGDERTAHVMIAAEKVRLSALAFIKAKRALIAEYPSRDPDGLQSRNLELEEAYWSTLSPEAIAEKHGKSEA